MFLVVSAISSFRFHSIPLPPPSFLFLAEWSTVSLILISNLICSFQVEDEMERMMENAHEKFVSPLDTFRKEQIGSVKKTKKDFEGGFATPQICYST